MNHQTSQFVTGFVISLGLGAVVAVAAVVMQRPQAPTPTQPAPQQAAPLARARAPEAPLPPAMATETSVFETPRAKAPAAIREAAGPVPGLEFQQASKPEASKAPETAKPAPADAKKVEIKALAEIPQSYGLPEDIKLGDAVALGSLSVQAIRRASASKDTTLVTLFDALAGGKVTVTETSKDGWVFVNNAGDKSVICFPGDLLLGGRKDRVIATCEVIEPGIREYQVPVFAVERERTIEDTKAKPGQFYMDATMPQADLNTRAAALADNKPDRVLKRVAALNKALAGAEEGSIRKGLGAPSKDVEAFVKLLAAQVNDDTVGFVVQDATGIVALDWFETKGLAAKQLPRLLRGYALTAQAGGYRNARSDADKDGDSSKRPTTAIEGGTEEATACKAFVRS